MYNLSKYVKSCYSILNKKTLLKLIKLHIVYCPLVFVVY